jgi:hypothetical protein
MKKLTRGRPSASAVLGNEMIGPIVGEVRGVQSNGAAWKVWWLTAGGDQS